MTFVQISNTVTKSHGISEIMVPERACLKGKASDRSLFVRSFLFSARLLSFLFIALSAEANTQYNQAEIVQKYELESCNDSNLKIEFLCNPKWEYHISNGALMVTISSEPMVTATFARLDSGMTHLAKLTMDDLTKRNLYRTGFKSEYIKINGQDSVVVRAFSRSEPERRVLDYFYIHDGGLFGVLFAVSPIDDWDNYKFLIKTMAESIKLLNAAEKNAV